MKAKGDLAAAGSGAEAAYHLRGGASFLPPVQAPAGLTVRPSSQGSSPAELFPSQSWGQVDIKHEDIVPQELHHRQLERHRTRVVMLCSWCSTHSGVKEQGTSAAGAGSVGGSRCHSIWQESSPGQAGRPLVPQPRQMPLRQPVPSAEQSLPSQHGWPCSPQSSGGGWQKPAMSTRPASQGAAPSPTHALQFHLCACPLTCNQASTHALLYPQLPH